MHFPFHYLPIIRYNKSIDLSSASFNAGVLGFNLNKWRRDNVTNEVIYWMRENKRAPLWFQGTQPILFIVGYKDTFGIDDRWNVDGLGWTKVNKEQLESAHILHWSGPGIVVMHCVSLYVQLVEYATIYGQTLLNQDIVYYSDTKSRSVPYPFSIIEMGPDNVSVPTVV